MVLPILTITGSHDDDQLGALTHYREFMAHAPASEQARSYLVIGPWDHAGTRTPKAQFGGLTFGPKSLLDIPKLHLEWYAWTMQGAAQPELLRKPVATRYRVTRRSDRSTQQSDRSTSQHRPDCSRTILPSRVDIVLARLVLETAP